MDCRGKGRGSGPGARFLESGTGDTLGILVLECLISIHLLNRVEVRDCPGVEVEISGSPDKDPPGILAIALSNFPIAQANSVLNAPCLVPIARHVVETHNNNDKTREGSW